MDAVGLRAGDELVGVAMNFWKKLARALNGPDLEERFAVIRKMAADHGRILHDAVASARVSERNKALEEVAQLAVAHAEKHIQPSIAAAMRAFAGDIRALKSEGEEGS